MKIKDKFLDKLTFYRIQKAILSTETLWVCVKNITGSMLDQEKDAYFVHMIYDNGEVQSPTLGWIADTLKEAIGATTLMRVKVNLYPRTDILVHHTPHTDYNLPKSTAFNGREIYSEDGHREINTRSLDHKGAILSLNTCDGHTNVNGEIFPSVKNRMLFFDPTITHNSTNCTDSPFRLNININYDPNPLTTTEKVISGHQNRL